MFYSRYHPVSSTDGRPRSLSEANLVTKPKTELSNLFAVCLKVIKRFLPLTSERSSRYHDAKQETRNNYKTLMLIIRRSGSYPSFAEADKRSRDTASYARVYQTRAGFPPVDKAECSASCGDSNPRTKLKNKVILPKKDSNSYCPFNMYIILC